MWEPCSGWAAESGRATASFHREAPVLLMPEPRHRFRAAAIRDADTLRAPRGRSGVAQCDRYGCAASPERASRFRPVLPAGHLDRTVLRASRAVWSVAATGGLEHR